MTYSLTASYPNISAPAHNELDVVFFGPGVGECILIHVGNNEWFVIDSCIFPGSKRSIALEYLEAIGVDPTIAVKRILATHWHDDHIRGISQLVKACSSAGFAMSAALSTEQFFQLVLEVKSQNKFVEASTSADELAEVFEHLKSLGRRYLAPDFFAADGSILFRGGFQGTAVVQALSPSAATIASAQTELASKLLTRSTTRRFKRFSPNDLSVAVHLAVGSIQILFGADLENTASSQFGWKAVLSSPVRPTQKASAFKIPHHGSETGHHDDVWGAMLAANPLAIVTPFAKQAKPLPLKSDVKRMLRHSKDLYATTWPPSQRPKKRFGVDRQMKIATRSRRTLNRNPGFVRLRLDLASSRPNPDIKMFGSATKLSQIRL